MCDIATVFSVVSGVVGFISDSQNAKNENARIAAQNEANRIATERSVRAQADIINTRTQQEAELVSQDKTKVSIEALQAASTARVASGEAGVSGVSIDALQRQFAGSKLRFDDAVSRNFQFSQLAAQDQIRSIQASGSNQIVSSFRQAVAKPSFFGAALRIGGTIAKSGVFSASPATSRDPRSVGTGPSGSIRNGPIPSVSF